MEGGELRERAGDLPAEPGVYQFKAGDQVVYIGKAVDLRSRVRSYADPRSDRIAHMVIEATDLEIAVTDTETQAVLLEANLIKRHQPRYNVRLTDDKSYPLVQITDHPAPRIEITRDPADAADVYGPYTNVGRVEKVVKALRETFGIRGCSDHKYANRDRPCQDYEIGLCTAPCTNEIDAETYLADVESVRAFLEGATGLLADSLEAEMHAAAASREYERAAHLRDRLDAVRAFHGGGGDAVISRSDDPTRMDVFAAAVEGEHATVAQLRAEGGKLVDRSRHRLDAPRNETTAAVLSAFIPQYYSTRELPDRLVLSDHLADPEVEAWLDEEGVSISIPGSGRDARLVDLALQNARRGFDTRDETRALADTLGIEAASRIEGFDVSHAHGKSVVGSNVTFVDGTPEKSGYRRKRLEDENDEYENMRRLLEWRTSRAVDGRDDRPDPDLLLIDGGDRQLSVALDVLDEYDWEVPVVAIAKATETVYAASGTYEWDEAAPQLHLLQRVRDEAHRFAVQYHQTIRDDIDSILSDVPGIGETLGKRLLSRFGSVKGIRDASPEELTEVDGIGTEAARTITTRL